MKTKLILLASALLMGNTFGAPIQIPAVPFAITAPGTYTVASNLTSSAPYAITINSPVAGKIILDLGGFTIRGTAGSSSSGVSVANPTGSIIVIRNGQLSSFWVAIDANNVSQATGWISNVQIENIVFSGSLRASVSLYQVNASSVTDCNISGGNNSEFGILDLGTQTGNKFVSDTFDGRQSTSLAIGQFPVGPLLNIDCHVTPVP